MHFESEKCASKQWLQLRSVRGSAYQGKSPACFAKQTGPVSIVLGVADLAAASAVLEVEEPPAIVPFQGYFTPSQRNLWIGVERSNIGPC
jgi:hypothetical protein